MAIRKIGVIGRTYRHAQRYRQILTVLFRYGFGDLLDSLKIEHYLDIGLRLISRQRQKGLETLSRAQRVRMAIEDLGPTFVKMGQILSTRPDLLPTEFLYELGKLQDQVPPFASEQAQKIIETELQVPLDAIFRDFEEIPLASASLGQVHRARLADGEEVVVKVQRPDIRKTIEVDLEILMHLATLAERHLAGWDIQRPTQIVEEFTRVLEKELDYTLEASHLERFARQFISDPTIYVPKVYRDATTAKVLTMEYVDAIKVSDLARLKKARLNPQEIARRGFDLIMKQIFVHGFFHADPHPGNIFILPNNVICFLDFGMMGRIGQENREDFADLIMGAVSRDEVKVMDVLLRLTYWEQEPDRRALQRDVSEFLDLYLYRPLKEVELGPLLQEVLDLVDKHHLRVPSDMFLMIKALSTVEGLGRTLDPDFDAMEQAAPFMRRIQLERLYPPRIAGEMFDSGMELFHLMKEFPGELREFLKQVRQGKMKVEFEHRGLEPMLHAHDRISNRLAFAIVLASLVIGSSLIVLSDIPPKWHDIPIICLAGFVISGAMGFWLLISIIRRGKL